MPPKPNKVGGGKRKAEEEDETSNKRVVIDEDDIDPGPPPTFDSDDDDDDDAKGDFDDEEDDDFEGGIKVMGEGGDDEDEDGEAADEVGQSLSRASMMGGAGGEEAADSEEKKVDKPKPRVWRPGVDKMEEDEELEYEPSAYTVYHKLRMEWPCLSFDILSDSLGHLRTRFPATMYFVAGTQADAADKNLVHVMKVSNITRRQVDQTEEDEESDESDDDDEPVLETRTFKHVGGVNRIRAMPQRSDIVATWAETGKVHLWDIKETLKSVDKPAASSKPQELKPAFTFGGHPTEGFAMDWSTVSAGKLATGDCSKFIYVWEPSSSTWAVDKVPYKGHTASVEDIQWSPNEATVFASCSVDKTVRIWDARVREKSMCSIEAHSTDVNVISWNKKVSHLLVSGADDGSIKIWDLRNFKKDSPAAHFTWHKQAITSVSWHPQDESVLAASSADDSLTVWDMALEADAEEVALLKKGADVVDYDVPPQLLFVHQGQKHIKELHFHPQIPSLIMSTAEDGMNLFKAANMDVYLPPAAAGGAGGAAGESKS